MEIKFPNALRYYHSNLNSNQKKVYVAIYKGLRAFVSEITVPNIPAEEISKIFEGLLFDNPTIFYVSTYSIIVSSTKKTITICPKYSYNKNDAICYTKSILKQLQKFDILKQMDDLNKELNVHAYCQKKIRYDYKFNSYAHTVIGAFSHNLAVCEGIAKFVKVVFDYIGVKCMIATGQTKNPVTNSMEEHAWNVVEIFGQFYHLDVTFDITLTGRQRRFDYFNLTEAEIKRDHNINGIVPLCLSTNCNYFEVHSLVTNSTSELENLIIQSLRKKQKNIMFKINFTHNKADIESYILKLAKTAYYKATFLNMFMPSQIEIKSNLIQNVFELNFLT